MPARRRYVVTLTAAERTQLRGIVQTGREQAFRRRRAHILLQVDAGPWGPGRGDVETARVVATAPAHGRAGAPGFRTAGVGGELGAPRAGSCAPGAHTGWDRGSGADPAGVFAPATRRRAVDSAMAGRSAGGIAGGGPHRPGDGARGAQKNRLQPWKVRSGCLKTEPDSEFVYPMEAVWDTYPRPLDPTHPVVCVDEVSQVLHQEVRTPLPAQPGQPLRQDYEYRRAGTANLFMITAPFEGWRQVEVTARRTQQDFAQILKDLVDVHFPQAQRITWVCDNLNPHKPSVLYARYEAPTARRIARRLEWVYTPKHASWLNIAEIEINVLKRQALGPACPRRPDPVHADHRVGEPAQPAGRPRELALHYR